MNLYLNRNTIIQKLLIIISLSLLLPLISIFLYKDSSSFSDLNNSFYNYIVIDINNHLFELQIANTPERRSKGLMFKDKLEKNKGMFFVFERSEIQTFWMKNTYIPLDIIFLDENLNIIQIYKNTKPLDTQIIYSSVKPSKYVIELLGGISEQINLTTDSQVRIIEYKQN